MLSKSSFRKSLAQLVADVEALTREKTLTENKILELNQNIKKGNEALLDIRESLATSDIFRRNIDDNIRYCNISVSEAATLIIVCSSRYRKQRADLMKMEETIRIKESEIGENATESVEFDIDHLITSCEQKKRKVRRSLHGTNLVLRLLPLPFFPVASIDREKGHFRQPNQRAQKGAYKAYLQGY